MTDCEAIRVFCRLRPVAEKHATEVRFAPATFPKMPQEVVLLYCTIILYCCIIRSMLRAGRVLARIYVKVTG